MPSRTTVQEMRVRIPHRPRDRVEAADRYKGMSLIVRQKVRTSCRAKVPTFRRADADLRRKYRATLRAHSMRSTLHVGVTERPGS